METRLRRLQGQKHKNTDILQKFNEGTRKWSGVLALKIFSGFPERWLKRDQIFIQSFLRVISGFEWEGDHGTAKSFVTPVSQ